MISCYNVMYMRSFIFVIGRSLWHIIVRCRIRLHIVLHIYIRQFYYYIKSDLEPIYCYICGRSSRLVYYNKQETDMQLFRYYNIFFFFFFFSSLCRICFHISGVRVKYKLFAYIFFLSFFK